MTCAQECSADQIPLRGQCTSSPWGWGCARGGARIRGALPWPLGHRTGLCMSQPPRDPRARPCLCFARDTGRPKGGPAAFSGPGGPWRETSGRRDGPDPGWVCLEPPATPPSSPLWVCGAPGAARRRAGRRPAGDTGPLLPARRGEDECYVQPGRAGWGRRPTPFAPPSGIPRPPPPSSAAGPGTSRGILAKPAPAPLSAPFGHLLSCHSRGLPAHRPRNQTVLSLGIQAACPPHPRCLTHGHPKAQLRVCFWETPSDSRF